MIPVFLYVFLSLFLLVIYFLASIKFPRRKGEKLTMKDITLVIPFRNEESKLFALLASLKKNKHLPEHIIFVDDHSEDNGVNVIHDSSLSCSVLENHHKGKKQALKRGIEHAKTEYILTMDADVFVPESYFESLEMLVKRDLYIFQVKMKGKNLLSNFAAWDYYFLNALNYSLSSFMKPIVASGANLLFRKDLYEKAIRDKKYWKVESGDDAFLLRTANKLGKDTRVVANKSTTVSTNAPEKFKDFMSQRVRWAKKVPLLNDYRAMFVALVGLVYHVLPVIFVIKHPFLWQILYLKMVLDFLILFVYMLRIGHFKPLLYSPLFTILYPFYFLWMAFTTPFLKSTWKGR